MAAASIDVSTVVIPNQVWSPGSGVDQYLYPNSSISYNSSVGFISLISTNRNDYSALTGLMYIPVLPYPNTACGNSTAFSMPGNVTLLSSLPNLYPYIAIFPWTTPNCAAAYLNQTIYDRAYGVLTFQPAATNSIPAADDTSWRVSDNSPWQEINAPMVYAISAQDGAKLMTESSYYSGSMSAAPFGNQLTQLYNSTYLPRIWVNIELNVTNSVNSGLATWVVFVLIIGVMFVLIMITWAILYVVRKRHRRSFQERLQRGEIDLEALGIKKTNVPQGMIDEMPTYPFRASPKDSVPYEATVELPPSAQQKADSLSPQARSADEIFSSSSQPACPVCLDDFVHDETSVRELPCKHIFHPDCIDLYLRDSSSLCPMCKSSALPRGYCPVKITNVMVRRERVMQSLRSEAAAAEARASQTNNGVQSHGAVEMTALDSNSEVTLTQSNDQPQVHAIPADVAAQGPSARRAWHRERLARQQQQIFAEASHNARLAEANRSLWRRTIGQLVPSLA